MKIERTKNSIKGIISGIINKILLLIIPFCVRTVFIKTLGIEYLGLNSLFTSLLSILNLAELGIGSAIVFSLYSSIVRNDVEEMNALINFYKKVYKIIGLIILSIGLLMLPFIKFFCKSDVPIDINIHIIYLLFLLNSVLTYFLFAYKNSLLLAYQKNYIINNINSIVKIIMNIFQAFFLLLGKDYYIYVIVLVMATIVENLITYIVASNKFPDIKGNGNISKKLKDEIYIKVKALFLYKIGSIILSSIDSVVISSFLGLTVLGKYNNYYYVITTLFGFFQVYTNSLLAGIGNSIVVESIEKNKRDFDRLQFIQGWIVGWCSVCLICLYQDFISLWLGSENLFSIGIVVLLVIYFYVWKMMDIINLYKEAGGLWEYDKYRPIIASIVNLLINIILVKIIGLYGIVISTIVSIVIIILPWSTYILYKKYFKISPLLFYIKYLKNFIITSVTTIITYLIVTLIQGSSILIFFIKISICCIIPNIIFLILYFNDKDCKETIKWIVSKIKNLLEKEVVNEK